jgi:hypothetical protein
MEDIWNKYGDVGNIYEKVYGKLSEDNMEHTVKCWEHIWNTWETL